MKENPFNLRLRQRLAVYYPQSRWLKIHVSPYMPAGVPDIIGSIPVRLRGKPQGLVLGVHVEIETKKPGSSNQPTGEQLRNLRECRAAGGIGFTCWNEEHCIRTINKWLSRRRLDPIS